MLPEPADFVALKVEVGVILVNRFILFVSVCAGPVADQGAPRGGRRQRRDKESYSALMYCVTLIGGPGLSWILLGSTLVYT